MVSTRLSNVWLISVICAVLLATNEAFSPTAAFTKSHPVSSIQSQDNFSLTSNRKDVGNCRTVVSIKATRSQNDELVVIPASYRLGLQFGLIGLLLDQIPYIQFLLGLPVTLLSILFLVQASRIRFIFSEDSFELRSGGDALKNSGENKIVGGENVWSYDSFVNWEFFPKGWIDQPQGPVLAYFKETQTPSEMWGTGPGKIANSDEFIEENGAVPGQVHFFPVLCNAQLLRAEFEKRNCAKL